MPPGNKKGRVEKVGGQIIRDENGKVVKLPKPPPPPKKQPKPSK